MDYKFLKQADLFERISQRIPKTADKPPHPPFTLILGSGFSKGIIPTTAEIVRKDLPWWKWCQRADITGAMPNDFLSLKDTRDDAPAKAEAKVFWERVHNAQPTPSKEKFELGTDGLPKKEMTSEAYRFALSAACTPGLNSPNMVRRYFGDIIRRAGNRLNPAHLFLASIIAEKKFRRLFGTIFTTNFDPLLQRSLQLVNAPYFVSDRPETLQYPDDDDVADAVHVIHAHGSIYRYLLLNSPNEIEKFAVANQPKLQEYFRKHAVLIVGFSGWDDAITRALKNVDQFNLNLYWCDRNSDPDKSSLTADAREILKKHANAFYVPIQSADALMVQMHQHLTGHTLPRIFRHPILAARDQIDLCDLTDVKLPRSAEPSPSILVDGKSVGSANSPEDVDLGNEVQTVRKRLDDAQDLFTGKTSTDPTAMLAAQVRQRFAVASDLYFSDKYAEALPHFDFVINANVLGLAEQALAQFRRGFAYSQRGQAGDVERAIADFTAVIEMPDAPAEPRAKAHVNRGINYGMSGDLDREIADYTAVIEMPDAPAEQRAMARVNRGIDYGKGGLAGDLELAIADCTAVIDMPDAPAEQQARACIIRGITFGQRGQAGDLELAIADYTALIDMPDAPREQRSIALKHARPRFRQTWPGGRCGACDCRLHHRHRHGGCLRRGASKCRNPPRLCLWPRFRQTWPGGRCGACDRRLHHRDRHARCQRRTASRSSRISRHRVRPAWAGG